MWYFLHLFYNSTMHIYQIVFISIAAVALVAVLADVIYLEVKRRKAKKSGDVGEK